MAGGIGAHALENYLDGDKNPQLPQMPVPVAQLLQRCFQENPDDRPRTLREVAEELRDSYRHLTGEAHPRPHPGAGRATADSLNNRAVSLLDLGRHSEALELAPRRFPRTRAIPNPHTTGGCCCGARGKSPMKP